MKNSFAVAFWLASALLLPGVQAQQPQEAKGFDMVDSGKVDQAIKKGCAFLKTAPSPGAHRDIRNCDELIALTLLEGGVPLDDPVIQKFLASMLAAPLERTYNVVLQAMFLEEVNRVKYQERIWQCAQFLVDNQCANGQWAYGEPTEAIKNVPTTAPPRKEVASGGAAAPAPKPVEYSAAGEKAKPKVLRKLPVARTKQGPAGGDNSNSQYAALGLRACFDAGIRIPEDTVLLAKKWWYDSQHPGSEEKKKNPDVATGPGAAELGGTPRGWCYGDVYGVCKGGPACGSMTAGACGAVVIYDYMQGKEWKRNTVVKNGLAWIAANWSVTENKGPAEVHEGAPNAFYYYYLYALERLGMLYDTGKIGGHLWYPEGAKVLLDAQKADGAWEASEPKNPTWDTCFAILFLKRATRPLVASTGK
jgi:hypothetical protein